MPLSVCQCTHFRVAALVRRFSVAAPWRRFVSVEAAQPKVQAYRDSAALPPPNNERTAHETMFISAVGRSCVLHAQPIAAFRRRYLEPEHINGKSAYTVTFDSNDLVRKSVAALDEKLYVPAVEFVDLP